MKRSGTRDTSRILLHSIGAALLKTRGPHDPEKSETFALGSGARPENIKSHKVGGFSDRIMLETRERHDRGKLEAFCPIWLIFG
jgi:hypothetical protein